MEPPLPELPSNLVGQQPQAMQQTSPNSPMIRLVTMPAHATLTRPTATPSPADMATCLYPPITTFHTITPEPRRLMFADLLSNEEFIDDQN
jgi:hypothetical protein